MQREADVFLQGSFYFTLTERHTHFLSQWRLLLLSVVCSGIVTWYFQYIRPIYILNSNLTHIHTHKLTHSLTPRCCPWLTALSSSSSFLSSIQVLAKFFGIGYHEKQFSSLCPSLSLFAISWILFTLSLLSFTLFFLFSFSSSSPSPPTTYAFISLTKQFDVTANICPDDLSMSFPFKIDLQPNQAVSSHVLKGKLFTHHFTTTLSFTYFLKIFRHEFLTTSKIKFLTEATFFSITVVKSNLFEQQVA